MGLFNFFKQQSTSDEKHFMANWKAQQKKQLSQRRLADFSPIPETYYEKNRAIEDSTINSSFFQGASNGYQTLCLTILPLKYSAKELIISYAIAGIGPVTPPSVVFNESCHELQQILETAIQDIPSRLLVYLTMEIPISGMLHSSNREENLSELKEFMDEDSNIHPFIVTHNKLIYDYIVGLSNTAYKAFIVAINRLHNIDMWSDVWNNNEISLVALDTFSSLSTRKKELEELLQIMKTERLPITNA